MLKTNEAGQPEASRHWHAIDAGEVAARLSADVQNGLSQAEAGRRLEQFGPNTLQASDGSTWLEVLGRQFVDVLILILFVAAGVSMLVGEWTDAVTILAIIALNGVLGFFQEWKAEKALAALRDLLQPTCQVIRDGQEQTIEAKNLVPGDLVQLETGGRVPADLRLLETLNLAMDESALTGESVSVGKQGDSIDSGT
ncbi:MAG: HAD-IC family P-type ATPase, partial [Pirellulales bacterium]|nr:HAD-IC family P-type ATPase [Pirellulales bacterium]